MILVTKGDSYREFTIKGVNYAIKTEMQKVADVDDHDDDGHSHHVSIFCSAMKLLNEGANPNCVVFLRLMCAAIEIFPKAGKGVSRVPKTH